MDALCDERFEDDSPGFGKLRTALTDVRQVVHQLLEKKREKEPDPVEEVPVEEAAQADGASSGGETASGVATGSGRSFAAEPADRRQAVMAIVGAATFLRKREPFSPAPYLLLRGLRWGELRTATRLGDSTLLEAPPTELRQQIKKMALSKKWAELLEAGGPL